MTATSLALTVPAAELEQLQQTEGSPLAIARESVLTGLAPSMVMLMGLAAVLTARNARALKTEMVDPLARSWLMATRR